MSFQNIPPPLYYSSIIQERSGKIPDFTKRPRFLKVPNAKDLERAGSIHTKIMRKSTEQITNDVSKRAQHFHDKDIGIGSLQWQNHSISRTSTLFLWNQKHTFWQRHHPARVLDSRELHRIPRSPKVVCTWNQKVPQRWVLMKIRVLTACSCSPCSLRSASILSEKMMSQNTKSYPRSFVINRGKL